MGGGIQGLVVGAIHNKRLLGTLIRTRNLGLARRSHLPPKFSATAMANADKGTVRGPRHRRLHFGIASISLLEWSELFSRVLFPNVAVVHPEVLSHSDLEEIPEAQLLDVIDDCNKTISLCPTHHSTLLTVLVILEIAGFVVLVMARFSVGLQWC